MDEITLAQNRFSLLDYIPLGAFVLREDFKVIYWNKHLEYWTNIGREKILGVNIEDYYPQLQQNKYTYRLQQLFQYGMPTIFSSELHHHLIPCLIGKNKLQVQHTTVTPISSVDSKGYYALFLLQDVTDITERLRKFKSMELLALEKVKERKEAQKKLEQRNFELEQLNLVSKLLQNCTSLKEAYQIIDENFVSLFAGLSGALLIYNHEGDRKQITSWGMEGPNPDAQGSQYSKWFEETIPTIQEKYLGGMEHCFFPLIAKNENLGFLYLSSPETKILNSSQKLFALTVCEQIALILANLKLRESLENLSIRDPLTGLYNRRYLEKVFKKELARAERNNKTIGVIIIDVDYFKKINDTYGHQLGDQLLQHLGECLEKNTRSYDIVCRYGGEEFLIIVPEATLTETLTRAEQLSQEVKKISLESIAPRTLTITVSMGVSCFPEHGTSSAALILAADLALYHAKREGRDRVVCAPRKNR